MTDQTKKSIKRQLKETELEAALVDLESSRTSLDIRKLDRARQQLAHGPTLDMAVGVFRLESGVYEAVLVLAAAMERWADLNPGKPLTLYLFSPGGSVLHGFALYDTLRTLSFEGHEITTVIRGFAGSMASVVFLAGDRRLIGAESIIHQHEVSSVTYGKVSEMAEDTKFTQRLGDKIARIYNERTGMSIRAFKSKTVKKEWYAEAAEALELGIATEIA